MGSLRRHLEERATERVRACVWRVWCSARRWKMLRRVSAQAPMCLLPLLQSEAGDVTCWRTCQSYRERCRGGWARSSTRDGGRRRGGCYARPKPKHREVGGEGLTRVLALDVSLLCEAGVKTPCISLKDKTTWCKLSSPAASLTAATSPTARRTKRTEISYKSRRQPSPSTKSVYRLQTSTASIVTT